MHARRLASLPAALVPLVARVAVALTLALTLALAPSGAAAASKPALVAVAEWQVAGPFESGSREGMVHPLAGPGGQLPATWDFTATFPSALADGGRVGFTRVEGQRDEQGALTGDIRFELSGVDWDTREKEWGAAGVASLAVLVGRFELAEPALLVVDAARCGGTIAGQPFSGDPYAAGVARSVVRGQAGVNEVVLVSAGFGGARTLRFAVQPVDPEGPPVAVIGPDVQLPDLVAGAPGAGVAGVPVLNLTDEWLALTVEIESELASGRAESPWRLAPLAALKVPVPMTWKAPAGGAREAEARVRAVTSRGRAEAVAKLAVREPGAPRRETFVSRIDGSAQVYGIRPSTRGEGPGQSLIMSTHGAGVDALGQVNAYGPKDGVHVVAPTNRRPFGFDWHDWGRLDFEEVHDLAVRRLRPDPARVHLTGHSMGGHGAWILGTLHADEFASVGPSAGWASYDTYMPFTMRRSTWLASPELNALLLRGLASGRVSPLLENLRDLPVQVLHGGKDDNVPPTQARMLTGLLERLGGNVTYVEAPNEGHWSDLDLNRPGADSVDPAIMDKFWAASVRDPWPRRVTFVTPDADIDPERYWVRLDRQRASASETRVEAEVTSASSLRVATRNVQALSLRVAPELGLSGPVIVDLDGVLLPGLEADGGWRSYARDAEGAWALAAAAPAGTRAPNEHPGGLAKALFTPFVIVLPTQGDPARCEKLAAIARNVASAWWVRGNGLAPLVRDVDVTPALRNERGLMLIGGADVNAETARIARDLLVVASPRGVTLASRPVAGAALACAHWQPNPLAPSRRVLVLQATAPEADALLGGLSPVGAGLGLPDFIVASARVRLAGFGGFEAAGFWSSDWKLDPASTWRARD